MIGRNKVFKDIDMVDLFVIQDRQASSDQFGNMEWKRSEETIFPTVGATGDEHEPENPVNRVSITSLMKITSDDTKEFMCGWGAAVINVTVTYPINKIIFRQVSYLCNLCINLFNFSYCAVYVNKG